MKTMIFKSYAKVFSIVLLLTPCFVVSADSPELATPHAHIATHSTHDHHATDPVHVTPEQALNSVLGDLLDLSKEPKTPRSEWVKRIMHALEKQPSLKPFCTRIKELDQKNAGVNLWVLAILQHKNNMPKSTQQKLMAMDRAKLLAALTARINNNTIKK